MSKTARKLKLNINVLRAVFLCLLIVPLGACKDTVNKNTILYPLTIVNKDKTLKRATFQVERALTRKEMEIGLMHRKKLAQDSGMIFIYPQPAPMHFWMKNTYIPLDMIFINAENEIIHIYKNAKPHDLTPISSGGFARAALEINAGLSDKYNISVGDHIIFNDYP